MSGMFLMAEINRAEIIPENARDKIYQSPVVSMFARLPPRNRGHSTGLLYPPRLKFRDVSLARKHSKSRNRVLIVPVVGNCQGQGRYVFLNCEDSFMLQSPSLLHHPLLICTQKCVTVTRHNNRLLAQAD